MLKYKYLKLSWLVITGVTEANNTKLPEKLFHVAFSLAFKVIFQRFGAKC